MVTCNIRIWLSEYPRIQGIARFSLMLLAVVHPCSNLAKAVEAKVVIPSHFKYAGGTVPEWKGPLELAPEGGQYPVTWQYPVFQGSPLRQLTALNQWLRTKSIEALFQDSNWGTRALSMRDSEILHLLTQEKAARESASTQSELTPTKIFGPYVLLRLNTEWLGQARPQHGIEHFVFDFRTGKTVSIERLFKPQAEGAFVNMLKREVARSFEDDESKFKECTRNANIKGARKCERLLDNDNLEDCIRARSFDWGLLTIESIGRVSIQHPHMPGWFGTCGDGYYLLEGKRIERLFVNPAFFRTVTSPEQLKP